LWRGVESSLSLGPSPNTGEGEDVELVKLIHENESGDWQIDKLVYELYGLSEEEIKIVEG